MKRNVKRWGAWIMALVMLCSLVMVPAGNVEAAETVSNAIDESRPVYVELKENGIIPAGKWGDTPSVDLTQYDVIVHNNSEQLISDWQVTIMCQDASSWNAGWNGASQSGNTITVVTYKGTDKTTGEVWTNAEIEAGKTGSGAGFQIVSSAIANATVTLTYKVGESSGDIGDDATATDPAVIGQKSDKVKATIVKEKIDGSYHAYYLQVSNRLSESISDWIVAIPVTGITSSQAWDTSWAKVKLSYTDSYLYLTPSDSSSGVITAGGSFGSTAEDNYKFNYTGSNDIDTGSAIVYYKTGNSASGVFDSVVNNATQASGSSGGSGGSGESGGGTFDGSDIGTIDSTVGYNFAKALQYSLYFYDANMCGDEVNKKSLYSSEKYNGWRGNCHVNDKFTYNGKTYSAVGGFHDAGDHVKFGLPMAQAMSSLGMGYMEFGQAYDELGQTGHLKTIVDHYCEYVKRCTVLNSNKEVEAFCYQVGHGQPDHNKWTAPEVEDETATERYFTLVATASNPATDIVSETAAALAINYINFGNVDDLEYAKKLFAFAKKYNGAIGTKDGSFYGSSSYVDDYAFAAAMLYKATKDSSYKNAYKTSDVYACAGNLYDWDNVYQAAALYSPDNDSSLLDKVNGGLVNIANSSKDKYYCYSEWGSARYNCNAQLMAMIYNKKMNGQTAYPDWAKYQMSIILGNNSLKKNLVVGYNENSPKQPHHRAASGLNGWDKFHDASVVSKYTLFGALVGGPRTSDFSTYVDLMDDDHTSEVTLDYNASFVGALAALYLENKNSTEEGFSDQTINEKFYGGSEFSGGSTTTSVESVAVIPETTTIEEGKTVSLTASITPKSATNKKVTWSSSDTDVVTVSDTGVVTAVKAGTSTITVTTDDGGFTATCEVTVTKAPPTQAVISGSIAISVVSGTTLKDIIKDYTVTAKKVDITKEGTLSWKKDGNALLDDTILTTKNAGSYTLVFKPADTDAYATAELPVTITVTKKENTLKPIAPTVASKTDSSVTLSTYVGDQMVEYGIKQGNEYRWQESPKFEKLSPYSDYTFALRYAATDEVEAGAAGASVTVKTYLSEKDTYIVDLSKLKVAEYVEAHNETITYDSANKLLTLNNKDKTYTLTGDGTDITVVSNGAEIILVNANAKSITSTANISVKLEGENVVKEGLASDATITIDKNENVSAGKLTVDAGMDGAIVAGKIIVNGGDITANGTDSLPALKADTEIDLIGGNLTANVGETATSVIPIQVDTENENATIVVGGCTVGSNVTKKNNPIYNIKDVVDQNGEKVVFATIIFKDDDEIIDQPKEAALNSKITLPSLPIKKGYHPEGWRRAGGGVESVGKAGDEQTVDGDIAFEAVYTKITGTLDVTVQQAQDLTTGYVEDGDGVAVKIANNTNVTFDELNLAIDSDAFMLDESKLEQLKSGESRTVIVKLKNGKVAGNYTTQLTVTVSSGEIDSKQEAISRTVQNAVIAVTGINVNLDKNAIELTDDQSATVKATATVLPENATNKQVTWKTSDSKIATVDSTGVVTVLSEGTVDIIATAADGSNITGKATLAVAKKKTEEKPDPDDSGKDPGQNPGGSGEVEPGKDPNKPAEEKPNGSGGQNGGSGTGATGNTPVQTPAAPSAADEVKATGIQVTADVKKADNMLVAGTMKLAPKKKMQLNVAFLPEDADEEEVTFTSSNPKVAIVDEDGEITAGKNPGKTTITVKTERGLVKSFRIQVMKKAVTKVKLQVKTKNLKVGKSMKVKATLSPNKKLASNIIYWTSSNEDVVTVTQKGVIKGLKKGKAKITAVAADGSGKKATVTIKVK